MPITTFASGTTGQTAGGAETTIASINAVGKYQLWLDFDLMAAGDVVYIRRYKIVKTGGAVQLADGPFLFSGVDGSISGGAKVQHFGADWNDLTDTDALKYTIEQPFGTTRALPYAVVKDDALGPGGTAQTGDAYARLGAPAGASIAADLVTIAAYVDTEVGAIKTVTDGLAAGTTKVTPIDVDGLTHAKAMEVLLAVLANVAAPSGATVVFKRRDGTTTSVTLTYGAADGERTASVIA